MDFTVEVERSLRVLDGAVRRVLRGRRRRAAIRDGLAASQQIQSAAHCFVNKMDRTGADFEAAVAQMRERLAANAVPDPDSRSARKRISRALSISSEMQAIIWTGEELGATV